MGTWIQAAVAPTIALLVLWRGCRRVGDDVIERWQRRFGVAVDDADVEYVRGRLHRARSVRSAGVAIGIAIAGLPSYMNLIDNTRSSDFANPLVGNAWLYGAALGSLAAELFVLQRPARRAAALVRRRAADYVGLHWWRAVGGALGVAVVAAIVEVTRQDWRWWYSLVGLGGALLAAGALALGLRAVVDRPALATEGHLRDIDEAFRSYGAHHLMGASVALAGVSASVALEPVFPVGPLGLIGAFLALWATLMWLTLARDTRWSVEWARQQA